MSKHPSLLERFMAKVSIPSDPEGCWEWLANKNNKGYGLLRPGGSAPRKLSHRISYELHRGPIPEGVHVLHKCDNPGCNNPDHLFLGSQRENMIDKERKGRANHTSKLNSDQVREIRALLETASLTHEAIGAMYGVARRTITNINTGLCWRRLE